MSGELKQIGDDILASLSHLGPQKIDVSLGTSAWLETVPKLDNVVASDYFLALSQNILGNPSLLFGKSEFIAPYNGEVTNLVKENQDQLDQPKMSDYKWAKTNKVGSFGELAQRFLRDKNNLPKENSFLDSVHDFSSSSLEDHVLYKANEAGENNKDQLVNPGHKKEVNPVNTSLEKRGEQAEANKETDLVSTVNNAVPLKRFTEENELENSDGLATLVKPKRKNNSSERIGSFTELATDLLEQERKTRTSGTNPKEIGQKDVGEKSEDNIGLSEQKISEGNHQITKQQHPILNEDFKDSFEEPSLKKTSLVDLNTNGINHLVTIFKEVANKPESMASLELVKVISQLLNAQVKPSNQLPGEVVAVSQYEESPLGGKELYGSKENSSIIPLLKSSKITAQIDHSAFKKSKELKLSYRRFYGE